MCRYTARLDHADRPDKSTVTVRTPADDLLSLTDPALAGELGAGMRVMRLDRGLFDAMPVSLITTATVSALCALAGVPTNELRFRPNLVVAPAAGTPYREDEWVGSVVHLGDAAIRVDRRDSRCIIVNVDPESGRPDAGLLKLIGRHRQACAGVYGTVVRPGLVQVGDPVTIAT
jgi:uncharacterized protein YcbX